MKYLKIFLLTSERASEFRGRAFVWLLVPSINVFVLFTYWNWALQSNKNITPGWDISQLASYYVLLLIATALLMSHIEKDISERDIKEGRFVNYIAKPFSYYWMKFFEEVPYRLLQGFFGLAIFLFAYILFPNYIRFELDTFKLILSVFLLIFAFFISFSIKMIVGLSTFWLTDASGLRSGLEIITIIFAGFIMPLSLLPALFLKVATFLPFAYIIYFPIISFQNKLTIFETFKVLLVQIFWVFLFYLLYRFIFSRGIKKFTGVGQ